MEPALFVRIIAALLQALPLLGAHTPPIQPPAPRPIPAWAAACEDWDDWDKPGPPFKVYGNTYYVGTCGISAILITSDDGHVLIDSGTEAGADVVLANIRKLGFDPKDVKLLLASHEHFDHVGGMAKIQQATGAVFVSSAIAVEVMVSGKANPEDPQFGMHEPMARISEGMPYDGGDAPNRLGAFGITPIPTPGHTPGAMSWTWQACEKDVCRKVVYADSLSAVSRDDYRFVDHPAYLKAFIASLDRIAEEGCDILLTPHPSSSQMRGKLMGGDLQWQAAACADYGRIQKGSLITRLVKEDPEGMGKALKEARGQ